ncbi:MULTISPECIES: agmatinase [Clostridium]|jgi:agmatinase|uniref:Agmatinase n=2 Tax=Clostridium TaxID=1485 RepID=A0A151AMQ0_9CLOT|nr:MULTISPECIES: agmatinase [Clostridium]KYH28677.1 agmatinase [Clostridium colicanis DSM 13634]MBE6044985.1 agmatinase [Clostridium thermopalmarium]PRR73383.1 Agmatinase [Clostridium thermopalmarium DSM 5974]PVZ22131.1 agmatinase [Clostridium thermopalmarium DSM 5974]
MQRNKHVSTFLGFDNEYEESKIVVFGAPFDGTTSFRPGTRFAPDVMRSESYGLETYSPYLDRDLTEIKVFDAGDLQFGFGNTEKVLKAIKEFTQDIVADGKIPFMIGGEHLVSYPAVEAVFEKYKDLRIIHFDAHTDLRDEFKGERLSHATVLKRIWDFIGDGKMYHFGIRSGDGDEFRWAKEHVKLTKFNTDGLDDAIREIGDNPVYITIDLDVLDPSVFPGTGTPEAGGISFHEMMDAILKMKNLNVVGLDVVELSPHYDPSGVSNAVACKIVRELALAVYK